MKPQSVQELACPECTERMRLDGGSADAAGHLRAGMLSCTRCSRQYPILRYIPRFVPERNYCDNFGLQWNRQARTQLDKFNGSRNSRDRLLAETGWHPGELRGQRVLECGSGSGRFTQVLLDAGARVCSLDFSSAVEANYANNGPHDNLLLVQGDIYRMPFGRGSFDRVLCLGVLQHTPDVRRTFMCLAPFLKPGGRLVADVYPRHWRYLLHWKYVLRPLLRRMAPEKLYRLVARAVPWLLPVSVGLGRVPLIGRQLVRLVPVDNPEMTNQDLSPETRRQWSILNTFDWFSPTYDQPQTMPVLQAWFRAAGLVETSFDHMAVYVGRGKRPGEAERE